METAKYFLLFGSLLFIMSFTGAIIRKFPITPAMIYLGFGVLIGHHGLDVMGLHLGASKGIEVLSELAVIISLFTVGLKLRFPLWNRMWLLPVSLATLSMVLTIAFMSLFFYYFLHLSLGLSILLGAILSPTDPVLASDVQLSGPQDNNHLKFTLTAEGGLNDGIAFPFVMMGLNLLNQTEKKWSWGHWLLVDTVWPVIGGIMIGALFGIIISQLTAYVQEKKRSYYLQDFLTIASIALSYGTALSIGTYGFLAVFANALTLRQIELKNSRFFHAFFKKELPDEVLGFNQQLERIFEVISVVIIGLLIHLETFSWNSVLTAGVLFFIVRPLAIIIGSLRTKIPYKEKALLSWFGVRGIGSIYYAFYALNYEGFKGDPSLILSYTTWIIFISIILHGVSTNPLLRKKAILD